MAAGDTLQGKRLDDTPLSDLPDGFQEVGTYWKVLQREGKEPLESKEPGNLTGSVWMVHSPAGIGTLTKHTVREEDDGTISVRQGDGSSNSILISRPHGGSWHGYIEHGVWREV